MHGKIKRTGMFLLSGALIAAMLLSDAGPLYAKEERAPTESTEVLEHTSSIMERLIKAEDLKKEWALYSKSEKEQAIHELLEEKDGVYLSCVCYRMTEAMEKAKIKTFKQAEAFVTDLDVLFEVIAVSETVAGKEEDALSLLKRDSKDQSKTIKEYLKQEQLEASYPAVFQILLKACQEKTNKGSLKSQVLQCFPKDEEGTKPERTSFALKPVQTKPNLKAAASDGFTTFKTADTAKQIRDAIASVKSGAKVVIRVDSGVNVSAVIKTNGRHVKIYADSVSGHNINRSNYDGALFQVNGGSLTIGAYDGDGRAKNNLYINGKTEDASSALILVSSGALYLNKYSQIINGYADGDYGGGGGIEVGASGTVYMYNGATIKNCSSSQFGEYASSSTKTTHGGAVLVQNGGKFYMYGGTITNCAAVHGGAVMGYGNVGLYGGTIYGCRAENGTRYDALGGAVKMQGAIKESGTVKNTSATLTVNTVSSVPTGKDGYTQSPSTSGISIHDNSADGAGGAICANNGAKATIGKSNIYNNQSIRGNGGAICTSDGSYRAGANTTVNANANIHDNNTSAFGTSSSFKGGGIYYSSKASGTINGGSIASNSADYGGGIYHECALTMNGGSINGNNTRKSALGGTGGSGGGIYALGRLTVNGGSISNNAAGTYGGAAIIKSNGAAVSGGTFSGNTAVNNGGAFQLDGTMSFSNAAISNNRASGSGGGVAAGTAGIFNMNSGTISGNNAVYGGGVQIYSSSQSNLNGGVITSNTASSCGGGLNVDGATKINGTNITNNRSNGYGGGIQIGNGKTLSCVKSQITGNVASGRGGGVYVTANGTFTSYGSSAGVAISSNQGTDAGGIWNSGHTILNNNTSVTGNKTSAPYSIAHCGQEFKIEGGTQMDQKVYLGAGCYILVSSPYFYNSSLTAEIAPDSANRKNGYAAVRGDVTNPADASYQSGSDLLCSSGKRFHYDDGQYVLRPGNLKNNTSGCASYTIVLSEQYPIVYHKNLSDEKVVENLPSQQVKYWAEDQNLSSLVPTCEGYSCLGWNTKADGLGDGYQIGAMYTKNAGLDLYARWPDQYLIRYDGDEEDAGSVDAQKEFKKNSLNLRKNGFEKKDCNFLYWKQDVENYKNATKRQEGDSVAYEDLVGERDGGAVVLSMFSLKSAKEEMIEGVPLVDAFTMKANWNHFPIIRMKDEKQIFYENQKVTVKDLKDVVEVKDQEDDDIAEHLKIVKVEYEPSKKDQYQPETISNDDLDNSIKMDTYFRHLSKNEDATVKVTFYVKDSMGGATTKTIDVKVRYNEPPKLTAYTAAYFDRELTETPEEVIKELRENVAATDKEDEKVFHIEAPKAIIATPKDEETKENEQTLYSVIEDLKHAGYGTQEIEYQAVDSLGKESKVKVKVYIANSDPDEFHPLCYVRFINKEHLDTLDKNSIWKKDETLYQMLRETLDKEDDAAYTAEFESGE